MSDERVPPPRDSLASPFARVMAELDGACAGFETAVFCDDLGETIDYYSYLDPFSARLVGAHHGIVFSSAGARLAWLGAGAVTSVEIGATGKDSVTVVVAERYLLTVVVRAGALSEEVRARVAEVAARLRDEAGL